MRPQSLAAAMVTVLLIGAPSGAHAIEEHELLGLWWTPGGNVVDIGVNHHGSLEGKLAIVSPDNRVIGFQAGQPVLTSFSITGDTVRFEVATRPTQPVRDAGGCPPPDWLPFTGSMEAGNTRIAGTIRAPEFDLFASTADACPRLNEKEVVIPPYRRFTFNDPVSLDDRQIFRIEREGSERLQLEATVDLPQGREGRDGAPSVKLRTIDGEPVAYQKVLWRVAGPAEGGSVAPAEYETETDADGIARLRFSLLPNGRYAPANQIRRPGTPATFPRGRWRVAASVPELGLTEPVSFTLDLDGPSALLNFVDSGGTPIRQLTIPLLEADHTQRTSFQLFNVGERGPERTMVTFSSYALEYPPDQTASGVWPRTGVRFASTLCPVQRSARSWRVYESNPPLTLTVTPLDWPSIGATVANCNLHIPKDTGAVQISAIVQQPYLQVADLRVFFTKATATDRKLRLVFHDAYQKLDYLRMRPAPDEQKALIEQKRRYIGRAFQLLNEPTDDRSQINNRVQLFAANAYVDLLKNTELSTQRRNRAPLRNAPISNEIYHFPIESLDEYIALGRASRMAIGTINLDDIRNILVGSIPTLGQLRAGFEELATMPVQMAYVIAFGETWDGEHRDAVDRLVLGLEIAAFRIATPRWLREAGELFDRQREARIARRRVREARSQGIDLSLDEATDAARYNRRMRHSQRHLPEQAALARQQALEASLLRPAWELTGMPAELKGRLRSVVNRLAHMRQVDGLIAALQDLDRVMRATPHLANSARGRMAWRIGLVEHWLKAQNEIAHMRSLVRAGHAREVRRGQHFISRDGKSEVFVEFEIGGKRVDYAMARHFDDRIEVHIVDLTGQLRSMHISQPRPRLPDATPPQPRATAPRLRGGGGNRQHREKTEDYGTLFYDELSRRHPDKRIVVRATELYWRETDMEGRLARFVRTMALFR